MQKFALNLKGTNFMTNRICALLCAVLGLCGCSSAVNITGGEITKGELVGSWVVKMEDGKLLETNDYFVCRFNSDDTQDFMGRSEDGISGSAHYRYKDGVSYVVKNGVIYLVSEHDDIELKGNIAYGEMLGESGYVISYRELKNIDGGEDMFAGRTFAGIRSEVDYSSDIIGLWQGVVDSSSEVAVPYDTIRCEYLRSGLFNFYTLDDNGQWVKDDYNPSDYILMGNLLGTEWTEADGISRAEGWEIEISDDTMTWTASREGGKFCGFEFQRVKK